MSEGATKQELADAIAVAVSVLTDAMAAMKKECDDAMAAMRTEIRVVSANAARGMEERFRDWFGALDDKYRALPGDYAKLREDFDNHVSDWRLHTIAVTSTQEIQDER